MAAPALPSARILSIVRRDLTRYRRSPLRTALLFALPLTMAGIFALAFGGGASDISIRVLIHDQDQGLLSRLLNGATGNPDIDQRLELVPVGEEGYEMIERGEASALVSIPAGFSDDYLLGRPTTLTVIKNPAQRFLPQVIEEGVGAGAVVLSQASRVLAPEFAQLHGMMSSDAVPESALVAALSVNTTDKLRAIQRYALPPIVALESVTLSKEAEAEAAADFSILSYFLPGLSIMGILFLAQGATRDILRERETGLLRHLLTAPVTVPEYLVGKCLSVLLVTSLGFAVLVAMGVAAGATWGSPLAVAGLVLASSLAASGTLLLIMSLVGSERQGDAVTTVVIIVWSLLGGAFIPVSQMPDFLLPLSQTTLTYWATDGFLALIVDSAGLAEILPNLAVLSLVGSLFLGIGAAMLRRRISAGVL